jgi:cobalt-zinc-cadmium efflux system outer membrane protein
MSDRANRNLEITSQAYRIGGTDLVRYIDAERVSIEARVTYVRALARYHQSVVNLEYASGIAR